MKYHPEAVEEELRFVLNSRETFAEFREMYNNTALTDIQRAARYLYLIRASYGAKTTTFGGQARDVTACEALKAVRERLKRVVIECLGFEELIGRYDKEGVLFYCDRFILEA